MYRYRRVKMRIVVAIKILKRLSIHLGFAFILIQISCVAQQGTANVQNYSEDLSAVRPKFDAMVDSTQRDTTSSYVSTSYTPAKYTVNAKVDAVLDSIDRINELKKFVDGFTIQIYSGQNREEAIAAKSKLVTEANDLEGNLQYTQPKFIVTVGRYYNKIEAQKDLLRLKKHFSNAILVPEKILIN